MKKSADVDLVDLQKRIGKRRRTARRLIISCSVVVIVLLISVFSLRYQYSHVKNIVDMFPGELRGGLISMLAPASTDSERLSYVAPEPQPLSIPEIEQGSSDVVTDSDLEAENKKQDEKPSKYDGVMGELDSLVGYKIHDKEYISVVGACRDLFVLYFSTVGPFSGGFGGTFS